MSQGFVCLFEGHRVGDPVSHHTSGCGVAPGVALVLLFSANQGFDVKISVDDGQSLG